jgi:hypothetical protein
MALRPVLDSVVRDLLTREPREVTLDQIGEALGTLAVTTDEIDAILSALEAAGRSIVGPEGGRGAETLRVVLPAARALAATLGRRPTIDEIAAHVGVPAERVRHAIALGQVMGR